MSRSRHDLAALAERFSEAGLSGLTKGERIAATIAGILPPIRSERERQLRSRYGMTLEDYDTRLAEQDGVCAICREPWHGDLYIDHCHADEQVRGLLCASCNTLVGVLENRYHLMWDALRYLYRNGSGAFDAWPEVDPTPDHATTTP